MPPLVLYCHNQRSVRFAPDLKVCGYSAITAYPYFITDIFLASWQRSLFKFETVFAIKDNFCSCKLQINYSTSSPNYFFTSRNQAYSVSCHLIIIFIDVVRNFILSSIFLASNTPKHILVTTFVVVNIYRRFL